MEMQLNWDLSLEKGRLSRQLAARIRQSILSGELAAGDRLPAARRIAAELKIARGTVTAAIDTLVAEGALETRTGSGTYVAADAAFLNIAARKASPKITLNIKRALPTPDIDTPATDYIDLRPCRPSLERFPLQTWRRCMSKAASRAPEPDYGDPRGEDTLRREICSYLRRARGLSASPEDIIVTNGAVHAMHILSELFLDKKSKVAFENPGYPLARQTFALSGAEIAACRVDTDGIIPGDLPKDACNVKIVYVTPSHQFPTGGRLSLGRRRALIEWAEKRSALIVEDDYDGEFRYDAPPLTPLATMAPNSVVYCGTFSKTMFPGLRLGFAVAPRPIIDAMAAYRTVSEYAPAAPNQGALAHFIAEGYYEKHVHRMRRIYAGKRKLLSALVQQHNGNATLQGLHSGLNALIQLPQDRSAKTLSQHMEKAGVLIPPVARYDITRKPSDNALVFGYAAPTETEITRSVELLFAQQQ
ncbi:MAG: PLP-dependent aminotransferase family protein [Pseudomonadota bacterium]